MKGSDPLGPEPCASGREAGAKRRQGSAGQPSSRESPSFRVPTPFKAEGNTSGRASASPHRTRRGQRPWHVQTLLSREPGDLRPTTRPRPPVRIGKARSRSRRCTSARSQTPP